MNGLDRDPEAQVIFERSGVEALIDAVPQDDLSLITQFWNSGPRARCIALSIADDDLRRFERNRKDNYHEH